MLYITTDVEMYSHHTIMTTRRVRATWIKTLMTHVRTNESYIDLYLKSFWGLITRKYKIVLFSKLFKDGINYSSTTLECDI